MTDELVAFLTAPCGDEDEQAARKAADGDSARWFMGDKWNISYETVDWPCEIAACLLGQPYADHPDHRQEWAP